MSYHLQCFLYNNKINCYGELRWKKAIEIIIKAKQRDKRRKAASKAILITVIFP
jgi:hypothetical protein